jgi:DNA-binding transcriptional regulator YhcF (GntR family)
MSNKHINAIRGLELPSSQKFVLWVIADHANDKGDGLSWPSHAKIQADTGMSKSTIIRAVKELERRGIIRVIRSKHFNKYQINLRGARHLVENGFEESLEEAW